MTRSMNRTFIVGKVYQNYVFPEDCVVVLKTNIQTSDPDSLFYVRFQSISNPELVDEIPVENFEDWYGEY